ncbi:MAG: hypothetical protein EA341_10415, partial [Mongoliibacter sp.]
HFLKVKMGVKLWIDNFYNMIISFIASKIFIMKLTYDFKPISINVQSRTRDKYSNNIGLI